MQGTLSFLFAFVYLLSLPLLRATTYHATPGDYKSFITRLQPGDTLLLGEGIYVDRLRLVDVVGEEAAPIVISGPQDGKEAVFLGNACCNTVSLIRCAYVTISYLTIDGKHINYVDAVKAEGNSGNWTHHITLHHLRIIHHGPEQQTVGISTKCPSWDWHIHHNTIIGAGTGMYLGNSNGEEAFVNGLIEYNLIMNTTGYNLQIKRQNDRTRTTPGMPQRGRTIIRYNTFVKEEDVPGNSARPNLLVGAFPPTTAGKDDMYEIYGNFFWQNQTEKLFQGTGNLAFHHNILINKYPDGGGIQIQEHHGRKPQRIYIFQNTIWTKGRSIFFYRPDPAYKQIVNGNAVFSDRGIKNAPIKMDNIEHGYDQVGDYLVSPSQDITSCVMTPKEDKLYGYRINHALYDGLEDAAYGFGGRKETWRRRGAYASCCHPDWQLDKSIRTPVVKEGTTHVFPGGGNQPEVLRLLGNPIGSHQPIVWTSSVPVRRVRLIDTRGRIIFSRVFPEPRVGLISIPPSNLQPGMFLLVCETERGVQVLTVMVGR